MPRKKTPTSAVMKTAEAAVYVGLAKSTLEKKRLYSDDGPRFVADARSVRYRISDLDEWLATRVFGSKLERIRRRRPPAKG